MSWHEAGLSHVSESEGEPCVPCCLALGNALLTPSPPPPHASLSLLIPESTSKSVKASRLLCQIPAALLIALHKGQGRGCDKELSILMLPTSQAHRYHGPKAHWPLTSTFPQTLLPRTLSVRFSSRGLSCNLASTSHAPTKWMDICPHWPSSLLWNGWLNGCFFSTDWKAL